MSVQYTLLKHDLKKKLKTENYLIKYRYDCYFENIIIKIILPGHVLYFASYVIINIGPSYTNNIKTVEL